MCKKSRATMSKFELPISCQSQYNNTRYQTYKIRTLLPSPQRDAISNYWDRPVFRVSLQRPITWIVVMATFRGKISCIGRFPRGVFLWWPVPVQPSPLFPVAASSRGGQLSSIHKRKFPWSLNPAGRVLYIENHTGGRPWLIRTLTKTTIAVCILPYCV